MGKLSPRPKKARQSRSNVKVVLIVFFIGRISFIMSFFHVGQAVNTELYLIVLKRLREAVRRKRPEAWTHKTWVLYHDNAPPQASLLIREFLAKQETVGVPQPSTLQIGPCGLFLFPKLKSIIKDRRFQTVEEIKDNSLQDLRTIPQNTFQDAFQNWKNAGSGVSTVEGSTLKETSLIKL